MHIIIPSRRSAIFILTALPFPAERTFAVRRICFLLWRKYSPIWRGCQAYLSILPFSYKFSRFIGCKTRNMSKIHRCRPVPAAAKACRTGKNLL